MMKVECYPTGPLSANCYFVNDGEDNSFVVDPGGISLELQRRIDEFGAEKLRYILLTHGHFDHIGGVAVLKEKYPAAKIVIGEADAGFTEKDTLNLSIFFDGSIEHFSPDITVSDGDVLSFGDTEITVLSTPGHTKGGVCFIVGDCLFTGDTLMSLSYGRTDFPTSSPSEMRVSLKKLSQLEGDYKVYCGHGESTTLEYERIHNMFME